MASATSDRRMGLTGDKGMKAPVYLATTGNVTLSGEQTIDGTLTSSSRVLVWQQTNPVQNGIYDTSTGPWTRSIDANGNQDIAKGTLFLITDGFTYAGYFFKVTSSNPITVDTSAITFAQSLTSSSAILSFTQAGSGAISRSAQDKMRERITPDDFAVIVNGTTDATAAINLALAVVSVLGGGGVYLFPGKRYKVTSKISIPARCGIYSDGSAEIYAPAASFNNTTLANKYASNSAVLDLSGLTVGPYTVSESPFVVGVRITSEVSQGRLVDAIVARNARNVRIEGCEVSGFPIGCGIRASTLYGGSITRNFIHDFTDNAVWGTQPQITGIEIDGDRVNSVASGQTVIAGNVIKDLTVGATVLASWGYQTDGINVAHQSSAYLAISNNTIARVGEGIDLYCQRCTVSGNTIAEVYIFGIKLIHGASFNSVCNNSIHDFGLGGVVVSGSTVVGVGDTQRNVINNNTISSGNYNAAWTASDTYCIGFIDGGGTTGKPNYNTANGNNMSEGSAKYGWLDTSTGASNANFGEGNQIVPGGSNVAVVAVTAGGGACNASGSATYDPPSLADGAGTTTTVAVVGARAGNFAQASFSADLQGITLTAWVSASNTVSVRFQNESGGVLDLASGTLRVVTRG